MPSCQAHLPNISVCISIRLSDEPPSQDLNLEPPRSIYMCMVTHLDNRRCVSQLVSGQSIREPFFLREVEYRVLIHACVLSSAARLCIVEFRPQL
jgi:hypothetical protein